MNSSHLNPNPSAVLGSIAKLVRLVDVEWSHWLLPVNNTAARNHLCNFLVNGCPKMQDGEVVVYQQSPFEELARYILDENFISVAEIESAYGVTYTPEQKEALAATAPDMHLLLRALKHDCMVMPTLPKEYNLLELIKLNGPAMKYQFKWWAHSSLVTFPYKERLPSSQWLLVRKYSYPSSTLQEWSVQEGMLTPFEYVPSAVEIVYAITSFQRLRGTRLLKDLKLRTSSIDQCGQRVTVGDYSADGPDVSDFWDIAKKEYVGVASALQLNPDS